MSCVFNENQIPEIAAALRNIVGIVTSSGGLLDMSEIISEANAALDDINVRINGEITLTEDCIKRFKKSSPEKNYDDLNTSHTMLENSQLYHTDIIYSRIQIIIYIIGLLYFYKTVLSE